MRIENVQYAFLCYNLNRNKGWELEWTQIYERGICIIGRKRRNLDANAFGRVGE